MAISTMGVSLKWGTSAEAAKKVVDIKDFPDLIREPSTIEVTTLSDMQQVTILGLAGADLLTFTCNYSAADFAAVKDQEKTSLYYVLEFSDGSKFSWQGQHTCGVPGKGVDEVVEFQIRIAASSAIEFSAA